jgi:precorrin-2 methylase
MNPNEWAEKNYALQSQHEAEYKFPMVFWILNAVDTRLHNRKYEQLLPLIQTFQDSSWLTIGDGRYGSGAYYLQTHGVNAVTFQHQRCHTQRGSRTWLHQII